MRKSIRIRSVKSGLPPGALVHVGERKIDNVRISVITYDEQQIEEQELQTAKEWVFPESRAVVTWINVDGLHEVESLAKIGARFGLHPLVIEDILNTEQRPKLEDYGDYLFVVLKSLYHVDQASQEPEIEQISLVLGPNWLLSFQERKGDEFAPIRERVRDNKGRIRKLGVDYLLYTLIDMVVDQYFVILERFGDRIELLEEELVADPTTETLHDIHHLKREMVLLRKSVWPLREVIGGLERSESRLVDESTRLYLRDVYDHTIQVIDAVETFRDMLSGMLDIYLSSVSNRMNEVMKVLTIIATIFIPLTFIAGVYGMNFQYMPELEWSWGYPLVWGVMIVIAALMVVYFRRKRWL
ncbi:MAG: magnesium/cobalt transporter CorA [Anaerolineae bacterium]|nr:magnesium/cobalt transporter CorA [Anaerolineae bacterium]